MFKAAIGSRFLKTLDGIACGSLDLTLPDGRRRQFAGPQPGPAADLEIRDWRMVSMLAATADIGLAEAYRDGLCDTRDLTALLTFGLLNEDALGRYFRGSRLRALVIRGLYWLDRNTRAGSRRNIAAHYDLGNAFYRLWLDESMTYSSALFAGQDGLQPAQMRKYDRILDNLGSASGRLLEIGCGWGGFAELAVQDGLKLTGLTLSPAQLAWAQQRVPQADLRLQDYRDTQEQFDHLVSIEMFEAVGEQWWPTYFATVARALKPGGTAVIQSISIRDDLFAAYRHGTDFIQQYIFPGGMLPSRSAFRAAAEREGLQVTGEFAFGLDYARTLAEWRAAFEANWSHIATLGFDETFRRLWRLYLSYCEAGFIAGNIDVVQFELAHR
jgi:cyclopropane-fatty-acyl-phospholipid synthase